MSIEWSLGYFWTKLIFSWFLIVHHLDQAHQNQQRSGQATQPWLDRDDIWRWFHHWRWLSPRIMEGMEGQIIVYIIYTSKWSWRNDLSLSLNHNCWKSRSFNLHFPSFYLHPSSRPGFRSRVPSLESTGANDELGGPVCRCSLTAKLYHSVQRRTDLSLTKGTPWMMGM